MNWHEAFVTLLREDFAQSRARNSRYSLRSFAKKYGLSVAAASEVINGKEKWRFSSERAQKIVRLMALEPAMKNFLLLQMGYSAEAPSFGISAANEILLQDPAYLLVLRAFDLRYLEGNTKKIARYLGLEPRRVDKIAEALRASGLLGGAARENTQRPGPLSTSDDSGPREALLSHQRASLAMAAKSLAAASAPSGTFTTFTFCGDASRIQYLKEEIRKLFEKAAILMDAGKQNTDVFRLSVQLFPAENSLEGAEPRTDDKTDH